ncbi:replication factor C large subunit [Haloquadratum walsbyi]|uniref:Replication factor C large subunit n=1 Tax=Haloquadratum walsbyi J07HQW2 TaxID=1238425 RepID=U1PRI0_9EURY|nr:replication factor C large subunit [Haloquadratum walsbyi]ERG94941.1 MAG: DNA polymerase III subunit [Haloquadratum walsbyi J07HQW2]
MTDWTERYRPSTLSAVRGNDTARDDFVEWAESWDEHREPVVLHGAPGVGKTSAAHALANDMGWETVELNASDQRTSDVIERLAGRAAKNATLAGAANGGVSARQLIIMDEADNIHYQYDRGGKQAVTTLLKDASQPIVLIANEYYDMSRGLRNAAQEIEFRDISARSIVPVLRNILRQENIEFEQAALKQIAEANSGDLRAAIKDLQTTVEGSDKITVDDVMTGGRDQAMDIFSFLDSVLKEDGAEEALQNSYDVDETPDDLLKWIEDKAPLVYDGAELARAYEFLSNADVWTNRVYATDYNYRWWRYATDNLAGGVAAARETQRGGWTRYGGAPYRSTRDSTRDKIVREVAGTGGFSMATARTAVMPFLTAITRLCKPRSLTVDMAAWYELDEAGVSYVTGSGETTKKVASIVEDASERQSEAIEAHAGSAFTETEREQTKADQPVDDSERTASRNNTEDKHKTTTVGNAATENHGQSETENADAGATESASDADASVDADADDDDSQAGLSEFM